MDFGLSEGQTAIQEMAAAFAAEELAPHAVDWDQRKFFPVDTLRKAGSLGFGGIYVRDDIGGSGLSRLDAVIIFEALARRRARSCGGPLARLMPKHPTPHGCAPWQNDLRVHQILEGTNEIMRIIIARSLLD